MADNAKNYELMFLLKAQMDASIQNFSLVGGQVTALEKKIQGYNATLKHMDGYRQHSEALAQTEERLKELEAETSAVNQRANDATAAQKAAAEAVKAHEQAIDELKLAHAEGKIKGTEYNTALEREKQALRASRQELKQAAKEEKNALAAKNDHQRSIDTTREKLGKEREALRQNIESLKAAGVNTENLEAAEKELNAQLDETVAKQKEWADFGNTVDELSKKFTTLRMVATAAQKPLREIVGFYGESLNAAATLEYSMDAVAAVSSATAEETERLTAVVKEMGATTVFTAEEAAGALETMALGGWDAAEMISGLPAVVKLAAAAGEDLSEMTSIVLDGMNAFGLAGQTAAVKFADVLAKAATSSNTNVGLMGESLSYVETTAGNLGYSIEDVSVALAVMADNSLKGSVSGAALNTMLTRMSGANETAAAQMEKMGLSMYHADGSAKDLLTFMGELRTAFQAFGDDAQAAQVAAYKLAGQRGMRGLLAIVNQSEESWQKLVEDVYSYAGAADEISSVRLDNYTGQVQLLSDAWDALQTSVGETFLPTATEAVGALQGLVNGANEFVQEHPELVMGLGASAAAMLGLTTATIGVAGAVQMLNFAISTLKLGGLVSVGGLVGGLAAVAVGVGASVYLGKKLDGADAPSWTREPSQAEEHNRAVHAAVNSYEENADSYDLSQLEEELEARKKDLAYAQSAYAVYVEELKRKGISTDPNELLNQSFLEGNGGESEEATTLLNWLAAISQGEDAVRELEEAIKAEKAAQEAETRAKMDSLGITGLSAEQYDTLSASVTELATAYHEAYTSYYELYDGIFSTFGEVGEIEATTTKSLLDNIKEQNEYFTEYTNNLQKIREYADGEGIDLSLVWDTLSDGSTTAKAQTDAIVKNLKALPDIVAELEKNAELKNALAEYQAGLDDTVKTAIEQLGDTISETVEETAATDEARAAMDATIDGYLTALEDGEDRVTAAIKKAGQYWKMAVADSFVVAPTVAGGSTGDFSLTSYLGSGILYSAYASGTDHAAAGLALVGEEGPELLWMNGGERVTPAGETRAILSLPSGGGVTLNVSYNIQGSASKETVNALSENTKELERMVKRVLREEGRTAARRAMI